MSVDIGIGTALAASAADAHERTNFEAGGAHNAIVMDTWNNQVGREMGRVLGNPSPANAVIYMRHWLNLGKMTVFDAPGTDPNRFLKPSDT